MRGLAQRVRCEPPAAFGGPPPHEGENKYIVPLASALTYFPDDYGQHFQINHVVAGFSPRLARRMTLTRAQPATTCEDQRSSVNYIVPLARGTAAEGGRGWLTPYFLFKASCER